MLNKCQFIGRLGANPNVGTADTGNKYATFSIACDERERTKQDGTVIPKRTEWIPVVMWNGLAETAEKYLKKGALVYIEGKFRSRQYENKEGQTCTRTEVYADNMVMLDTKKEEAPKPVDVSASSPAPAQPSVAPQGNGELPF